MEERPNDGVFLAVPAEPGQVVNDDELKSAFVGSTILKELLELRPIGGLRGLAGVGKFVRDIKT